MMQPIEDRNRDDVAGTLWQSRNRLLLVNALMRPNSIVEAHEFGDQASEVRLVEYEHVVEQLTTEGADESLSESVHVRRSGSRPHDGRPGAFESPDEAAAELRVTVADHQFGCVL
jgi:hypothetical protein